MRRVAALLLGVACAQAQPGAVQWDFEQPLRVCTASIQDFGARCNGAVHPSLEELPKPAGLVPPQGWCLPGVDFCGYDVSVFQCAPQLPPPCTCAGGCLCSPHFLLKVLSREHARNGPPHRCRAVAKDINLEEGKDYIHVCLGEKGFALMIDDLAGRNRTLGQCDLAASTITASSEREAMGISFSRATHRSSLAVMTYAPLKQRGKWAFMEPLHKDVWFALIVTILLTPVFVFFFETIFSGRCATRSCPRSARAALPPPASARNKCTPTAGACTPTTTGTSVCCTASRRRCGTRSRTRSRSTFSRSTRSPRGSSPWPTASSS